jgi:hypothetical protein
MPLVQPLQGLGEEAVREALREFDVWDEFVQAVIESGAVGRFVISNNFFYLPSLK